MNLILEDEWKQEPPFDTEKLAMQVIEAAADYEVCPYEIEVNIVLTTNEGICEVNKEYRKIDSATDVLSFPALEYDTAADFSFLEYELDCFNPDSGELMLGDIMLSMEKVYEQAESYGHSLQREYAFLIAHSMLHLFGYDHIEPDQALIMEKKQEAILESLGIKR